jgi:hypothetical protein
MRGIRRWLAVVVLMAGRSLLLAWEVSAEQEESWRRFSQELSDAGREEDYVQFCKSL